ncbi:MULTISPECIES: alkaline phosphatase D family protein [unclassified Spirosoma]|uniref:alkaline phosphatase D family protein n=1 Tax=unclassified Spirosoma TaxID=2621999 RepID=UPI000B165EE2|nr:MULTISPECIES: alkaline phosphatase D family protein [unclassified Spirosoma]MBN8821621.1 alkaline phosphatase D family protein [Spirosoma sp.]
MNLTHTSPESRRSFVKKSASLALSAASVPDWFVRPTEPSVYQAMGTRVGDVTDHSAIVWTRLTAVATRNDKGVVIPGRAQNYKDTELPTVKVPVEQLEGACPGAAGFVRLRYGTDAALNKTQTTDWVSVSESTDFIHQFPLNDLKPDSTYYYASESTVQKGKQPITTAKGKFRTAPLPNTPSDLRFCLMTCQGYPDRDHKDGHNIYPAMQALNPHFACLTGDLVYYDNDMPRAYTPRLARYHWERMFSLPRLVEFNRNVGTYWLKDDHDTLDNDSSPGSSMGEFTFAEGQRIFHQQAPMTTGLSYRTFRWGKDLQIWLTDGRDFRSDNDMPDGPDKTIWGSAQKEWFRKTVSESSATWKVLISPTPLVGPDRGKKNDNHANTGFTHEGDEIRNWLKANVPDNFFVICGDRHWQYHSVHPKTGLHEFSIGPASDEHASGSPGEDKAYHRFHLVKGGFLSVDIKRVGGKSQIAFHHHDVFGKIVYEWQTERVV